MKVKGSAAVIVGGASGMGRATAERFAERGAVVAVFATEGSGVAPTFEHRGREARYYVVDSAPISACGPPK